MERSVGLVSRQVPDSGADFERFYEAEYPRLVRALCVLTANRAEAEDLAQEAMARTYERWSRVRSLASRR